MAKSILVAITKLSHFFIGIGSAGIRIDHMAALEGNIVETICKMEKLFPPGFFGSMEHSPMHLPYEAKVGGPIQYHWTYPF